MRRVRLYRHGLGTGVLTPIGLDIGASSVAAAQLRVGPHGREVFAAVTLDRISEDMPPGGAEIERLMAVLWRHGFKGDLVVASVPESMLLTSTLEVPAQVSGAPVQAMARIEMARSLACRQDALEVVWWPLPTSPRSKETAHLLATACTHSDSRAILASIESRGLVVARLLPRTVALSTACAPLLTDVSGLCAIVELGLDAAIIVVLHEGVVVYARSHERGALTSLMARMHAELGLTVEGCKGALLHLAEETSPGGDPLESLLLEDADRMLAEHLQEVAEELTASLSYACHKYPEAGIGQVLVSGPGALLRGTGALLADRFETPLRIAGVADVAIIPACLAQTCADAGLLVPVGLAAQGACEP